MTKELNSRKLIHFFVEEFYQKLLDDSHLKEFFQHITNESKLDHHLEVITDFWCDILLSTNNYNRNAMQPHLELHKTIPFKNSHFDLWLSYFNSTMDNYFHGENANNAKTRALSIATIMKIKLSNSEK